MPTNYPGALDSFTNPSAAGGDTLDDPPHDNQHADANDAIEAVETELGINPRGSHADVRARLDAMVDPITATDTVTVNVGDEQSVPADSYHTVFDIASAVDMLGGAIYGAFTGVRLTIDGTVVIDATTFARGWDSTDSDKFTPVALPAARAAASMKLELYNRSGASRTFGWRVFTRT